jgi:hypothetical protein
MENAVWELVHAEKLSFKKAWWLASATAPTVARAAGAVYKISRSRRA